MLFMVSNYQVFRVSAVDYGAVCQVYFLYMFYSKSSNRCLNTSYCWKRFCGCLIQSAL